MKFQVIVKFVDIKVGEVLFLIKLIVNWLLKAQYSQ